MLEVLLTVIPSLCWMVFRCFQLLSAPADRLARQLNIQIPHTPVISVHSIGEHDISLHWHISTQPEENIFFVVLVNGQDAGTLAHTCVKLNNLHKNTVYKIQILAVNVINNFRSESPPVYVRTAGSDVDLPNISPKTDALARSSIEIDPSEVKNITTESQLMSDLSAAQGEIAKIISDSAALSRKQQDEETALQSEYQRCKKELEEGHEFWTKKGSDLKGLEKNKDSLAFRKLKLSKILRNYELRRNIHARKITELKSKLKKSNEKALHLQQVAVSERSRTKQVLAATHGELGRLKAHISDLEHLLSATVREKTETETIYTQLQPLVNQFVKSTSQQPNPEDQEISSSTHTEAVLANDGRLTELGASVAAQIVQLQPEWATDFDHDLDTLVAQEDAWKKTFSAHLRKYIALHNSIESARYAKDPAYIPVPLSEYQASVEFGGFSNALKNVTSIPNSVPFEGLRSAYNPDLGMAYNSMESSSMATMGNDSLNGLHNSIHGLHASVNGLRSESMAPGVSHDSITASLQSDLHSIPSNIHPVQSTLPQDTLDAKILEAKILDANSQYVYPGSLEDPAGLYGRGRGQYMDYGTQVPMQSNMYTNNDTLGNGRNIYSDPYLHSPVSEPSMLYSGAIPVQSNMSSSMWGSNVQPGYMDSRSPYSGLSLSPPINVDPINSPLSQNGNMVDNGLFSNLILPSSHTNIWSNKPSSIKLGHSHSVSSGSTIWRDAGKRDFSPSSGFAPEFSPFAADPEPDRRRHKEK